MTAIIEFTFIGQQITKYINIEELYQSIENRNNNDIRYNFNVGKYNFQFKIDWVKNEIVIYNNENINVPFFYVNYFNIYFNNNLK